MKTNSKPLRIVGIEEFNELCSQIQYCPRQFIGIDSQGNEVYTQDGSVMKKTKQGFYEIIVENKK